jgi:hypothetical protein
LIWLGSVGFPYLSTVIMKKCQHIACSPSFDHFSYFYWF